MPDREKVIAWLADEELYYRDHGDTHNSLMACNALDLLKEQSEIVRCISCTFYRSDGECALHNDKWRPEGFCSWAIRKKGR